MVKEFGEKTHWILLAIDMKVVISMIRNMVMVSLFGHLGILIKGTTNMMKDMDMEKCISQMELFTKAIGIEASNADKLK